jgi:hypothetical protein
MCDANVVFEFFEMPGRPPAGRPMRFASECLCGLVAQTIDRPGEHDADHHGADEGDDINTAETERGDSASGTKAGDAPADSEDGRAANQSRASMVLLIGR